MNTLTIKDLLDLPIDVIIRVREQIACHVHEQANNLKISVREVVGILGYPFQQVCRTFPNQKYLETLPDDQLKLILTISDHEKFYFENDMSKDSDKYRMKKYFELLNAN